MAENGSWFRAMLMAKSLVGISFACEIAAAGRVVAGLCLGSVGAVPLLWGLSKHLLERGGPCYGEDPCLEP
jgi:hypothetical protein